MKTQKHRVFATATSQRMALDAFTWLAGEPEPLARFMALTGIEPHQIRDAAGDPDFFRGVLDYLVSDEPLLIACATAIGVPPTRLVEACRALGGNL